MNDGKPIAEAQTRSLDEAAANQAAPLADSRGPDHRRRRLIRGAVGIAPMVITLRSGALAVASCVGTVSIGTIQSDGTFLGPTSPPFRTPQVGDKCVTSAEACPAPHDMKISSGAWTGYNYDSSGKCSNGTGDLTSGTAVVLVSNAVTSFDNH